MLLVSANIVIFNSCIYSVDRLLQAQSSFRFSVVCVEKRTPGGGKTRGLGQRNDVLTACFIRFSLARSIRQLKKLFDFCFVFCSELYRGLSFSFGSETGRKSYVSSCSFFSNFPDCGSNRSASFRILLCSVTDVVRAKHIILT